MVFRHATLVGIIFSLAFAGCDENYSLPQSDDSQAGGAVVLDSENGAIDEISDSINTAVEERLLDGILAEPDQCDSLKVTTPRGLSCLHCMTPKARTQSDLIVRTLVDSCLQNPAINYLVDGSFGFDEQRLYRHIAALTKDGRTPQIIFYLANGASQRKWRSTPVNGFATQIPPEEFRKLISYDPSIRQQAKDIVQRLLPVSTFALNRGAVPSFIIMLEDNLDRSSFEDFANLVLEELPPGMSVSLGRNPCPSCYDGNDDFVPDGFLTELHQVNRSISITDGIISNDGIDYSLSGGSADTPALTLGSLKSLRDLAASKNNTFILWRAKYQGLHSSRDTVTGAHIAPANRVYASPTFKEIEQMRLFLYGK